MKGCSVKSAHLAGSAFCHALVLHANRNIASLSPQHARPDLNLQLSGPATNRSTKPAVTCDQLWLCAHDTLIRAVQTQLVAAGKLPFREMASQSSGAAN